MGCSIISMPDASFDKALIGPFLKPYLDSPRDKWNGTCGAFDARRGGTAVL